MDSQASKGQRARGNAAGGAGVSRVMNKLNLAIEKGNFYEAHQMYRTLYYRLNGQHKYSELEDLLFHGAVKLFEVGEATSGVDLTKLYVQVLEEGQFPLEEAYFERIARLYFKVPSDSPERDGLMATAIKWSSKGGNRNGHPRFHQILAHNLWNSKRYPESRHHFLHSYDGRGCGLMMAEFHQTKGYAREVDLFIANTVLQLVCLKKHIVAAMAFKEYTEKHPSINRGPPYVHPLLNFLWLLLLAIEHKKSVTVYSILVEKYKSSLLRDPILMEYLDKIGQNFFGLPPPRRPRPGGMFSEVFASIFSSLNEVNSSSEASTSESRSRMETEDLD